ncbi:MAG: 2-C-methyl-D-erythritol 4-phosphate cytidylyltransferase [Candidatus Eremiobacteraeota bacterium]|nr:2-C-methyl-D-erythritol 4-phosphate cytidylyltransferase [Candidatus Eremiobacteraeota bacterium]MBC5826488.1 2-C-methyl-D-erythritol 4-phosphate cytidylyltransferase [Candidatus Eremiobacteraeota bacterium]
MTQRVCAIVAAAGHGARFGRRKQLVELAGKPLAAWSLELFGACPLVDDVVVACDAEERSQFEIMGRRFGAGKVRKVVVGGARRQDSVNAAFEAADPMPTLVIVHDGARPFATPDMVDRVINAARSWGAAVVALRVKDTIKETRDDGALVARTIPRERLWAAQTPQAFAYGVLRRAYEAVRVDDFVGTDEAMLVERNGDPVAIVEGAEENIKITAPEDLFVAERIAALKDGSPESSR